ncbi:hypothetical protein [Xanthomonas phage X1]|nr:hypothetical protein [Xanthomonas phage X1]
MRILVLLLALVLAGCKHVPLDLTEPCYVPQKTTESVDEAVRLANDRHDALVECNAKLEKIRTILDPKASQ